MTQTLNILMAQMNPLVGAIEANSQTILQIIADHQADHDLIVFPELAICGYPPEDLLLLPQWLNRCEQALQTICLATQDCYVIIGHPQREDQQLYNAASVLFRQTTVARYFKRQLPNYGVFDERRYFTPGPAEVCSITCLNQRIGLCICEDLWGGEVVHELKQASIDILVVINASPFDHSKPQQREALLAATAQPGLSLIYVNMVGAQDGLVFDGQSLGVNGQGQIVARAPAYTEACQTVRIQDQQITSRISPTLSQPALIYQALILGLRDYVTKNQIPGVLLGLSGGVDSALTLAIAVDALGPDRVTAILLPSRYSATMSSEDALAQAQALGVSTQTISIEAGYAAVLNSLEPSIGSQALGITAENIQARLRAVLLMAVANHRGWMLISTSNKSEVAVGFTTLYGDMSGGYAVLKDVLKTLVYQLAYYRNTLSPVIPLRVLTRPPSAELAPNQTDQDRLPEYAVLDAIITGYMEQGLSQSQLVELGYPEAAVIQTLQLIRVNEHKRHQAPIGTKISPRAFGKDWRYPITSGR